MTIPAELEAQILRLFHAEKWRIGTIAQQLGLHRSTVQRVIKKKGAKAPTQNRGRKVDPYLPFINDKLKEYPDLPASALFQMVRARGFTGRPDYFRTTVARLRPAKPTTAYLRLATLPGDEAQVDWGHFGKLTVGRVDRPLLAFVIVLSYSRAIFLRFFLGQSMPYFLWGHQQAFERFGGIPRTLLYDNLKSVVLERSAKIIRFNETFSNFAAHYQFKPQPVNVARGNEKGRVERAIRYVRTNFFPGRIFENIDDLNEQADHWCQTIAMERSWQEDFTQTVADAYQRDKQVLMTIPSDEYPVFDRTSVRVAKTPYVRFDRNDYSVPHRLVCKNVTIIATTEQVRVLDQSAAVVATHARSYDRGRTIEDIAHIESLKQTKQAAQLSGAIPRLQRATPSAKILLQELAQRHQPLGRSVRNLEELLDCYGAQLTEEAIKEAIDAGSFHVQAVRQVLERRWQDASEPAPLPMKLPNDPRINNLAVKPHDLAAYDHLINDNAKKGDDHDKSTNKPSK